jgi:hypothetical protein
MDATGFGIVNEDNPVGCHGRYANLVLPIGGRAGILAARIRIRIRMMIVVRRRYWWWHALVGAVSARVWRLWLNSARVVVVEDDCGHWVVPSGMIDGVNTLRKLHCCSRLHVQRSRRKLGSDGQTRLGGDRSIGGARGVVLRDDQSSASDTDLSLSSGSKIPSGRVEWRVVWTKIRASSPGYIRHLRFFESSTIFRQDPSSKSLVLGFYVYFVGSFSPSAAFLQPGSPHRSTSPGCHAR